MTSASGGIIPDLVLQDANILTVNPRQPKASWMAMFGGRIVGVGTYSEDIPRARRTLSLEGATVVPGFHDAHVHTVQFGSSLKTVDLRSPGVSTLQELYDRIRSAAEHQPEGTWIVAENYDQNKLGGHPRLADLDVVAPRHLVRLGHTSRHMCFVNSRVLQEFNLENHSNPSGGTIERTSDGYPTGLLLESAMELLHAGTWPMSIDSMVEAIEAAHLHYVGEGLTAVQEAGVGLGLSGSSPAEAYAFQAAREQGRLRVRTTMMPSYVGAGSLQGNVVDTVFGFGLGLRNGFGDLWLRLGALKVFSDGSLIGRSAAMNDAYSDDPHNRGSLVLEPERLGEVLLAAHRGGWQIATHAIGDRAVDEVLIAYERCLNDSPRNDHRHRIEHAGVTSDEAVQKIARLGVIANPQGRFISEIGDGMSRALESSRVAGCYRAQSFVAAGIELPGSSDRPVVDGAPLLGIHDMVNRRTESGQLFAPAERLTPAQALRAYTYGSAYATFLESEMGSIEQGKVADFAILSDDLTSVEPERIREIEVRATYVDGRPVFDPSGRLS